jgi:hypothetical protein
MLVDVVEEDQQLWELLTSSKKSECDPAFFRLLSLLQNGLRIEEVGVEEV